MSTTCNLTNDEIKALYATMKLKGGVSEMARKLDMPLSTYWARITKASKKIEAAYPDIKAVVGDGTGGDYCGNTTKASPATPRKRKTHTDATSKAKASTEEGPAPKKEKVTAAVKVEEGDGEA